MAVTQKTLRLRRTIALAAVLVLIAAFGIVDSRQTGNIDGAQTDVLSENIDSQERALVVLDRLEVKGRAPKTGYSRDEFGSGWASIDGCDMRNIMLKRSLYDVVVDTDECTVLSGVLQDSYTDTSITFRRGADTSGAIQIDHVVALSDAWQKGAQNIDFSERVIFANDPLNLLAVDGPTNQDKGDADAASWLPPHKAFRCQYVARQIAVKDKYALWVSEAEAAAMKRVLNGCGDQRVPLED